MKKHKGVTIAVIIILVLLFVGCVGAAGDRNKDKQEGATTTEESVSESSSSAATEEPSPSMEPSVEDATEPEYTLLHGELESAIVTDMGDGRVILVIKGNVPANISNKTTIDQNYYNVFNLIQEQGATNYTEIQYWAVASMSNGEIEKYISFTVDQTLIESIVNDQVAANELGDYVTDLWILPSLL